MSEATPIITGNGSQRFVWAITAFSSLGGFLFGYDTGVVAGALLFVTPELQLSTSQEVSTLMLSLLCVVRMRVRIRCYNVKYRMCEQHADLILSHLICSDPIQASVVSITSFAAVFGCLATGVCSDQLGRRKSILMGSIGFILGGVLLATAQGFVSLLLARIVVGLAIGSSSQVRACMCVCACMRVIY